VQIGEVHTQGAEAAALYRLGTDLASAIERGVEVVDYIRDVMQTRTAPVEVLGVDVVPADRLDELDLLVTGVSDRHMYHVVGRHPANRAVLGAECDVVDPHPSFDAEALRELVLGGVDVGDDPADLEDRTLGDRHRAIIARAWFSCYQLCMGGGGHRTLLLAASAALLALTACTTVTAGTPDPRPIAMPVFHSDCTKAASAAREIPFKLLRLSRHASVAFAGVCVNGHGPFTFALDTGAAISVIDEKVAETVGFTARTPTESLRSFNCSRHISFAAVTSWSVSGVALARQGIGVVPLADPIAPALAGLIGSDVLSGYSAARFDFDRQVLTLGPVQDTPTSDVAGATVQPTVPRALTADAPNRIAMHVRAASTQFPSGYPIGQVSAVLATVDVSIGSRSATFAVDTGAAGTVLSPSLAKRAALAKLPGVGAASAGLSCRVTVHFFQVTAWSVDGFALAAQTVDSNVLPATIDGLLGTGTLQHYSPVVVDYVDGELLLGRLH